MTFRVLGPHERGRFAPESWGYLMTLLTAGHLNAEELESLIERAMAQIEGRIGLDDLRALMEAFGYLPEGRDGGSATVH